jgi:hypothetical protein
VLTATLGDSIRSKIGELKKKTPIKRPKKKKYYRVADQPIGERTLVRVAQHPAEIMEIDLSGSGAVRKRERRLGQRSCRSDTI